MENKKNVLNMSIHVSTPTSKTLLSKARQPGLIACEIPLHFYILTQFAGWIVWSVIDRQQIAAYFCDIV